MKPIPHPTAYRPRPAAVGTDAGTTSLAISALRDILPMERLGSAIALISSSLGIGSALGLPISAMVAEHANWHALFWAAAALSAVSWVLVLVFIPATPAFAHGRFDVPGALGLSGTLVCAERRPAAGLSFKNAYPLHAYCRSAGP